MFAFAALFNWFVGVAIVFFPAPLFQLFQITPLPTEPLFAYLLGWLVFAFGIGYYWISRDPVVNKPVIRLGIIGKLGVVATVLVATLLGDVSWQMNILSSADLVFAGFFIVALRSI
jgi:hypothetical protein